MTKVATTNDREYLRANNLDFGIRLEIEGLHDNGDGTFTLAGVKPIEMDHKDFEQLRETLVLQGVARSLADRLCDEAHATIAQALLADAIAQRTKRVG